MKSGKVKSTSFLIKLYVSAGLLLIVLFYLGCRFFPTDRKPLEQRVILDWYNFALECERYAEGYKGGISARTFAYLGIAGAEISSSVLGVSADVLNGQKEYPEMPQWDREYPLFLPAALNAGYAYLFEKFYSSVPMSLKDKILEKRKTWHTEFVSGTDGMVLRSSSKFGKEIAALVYQFAATDSIGHLAHLYNYDKAYKFEDIEGVWEPCKSFPMPPLLPHWGKARSFVAHPARFLARPLAEFSFDKASVFYRHALEVYTVSSPLSDENQWIAEFWSDDLKGNTFTPAGRWISIANQAADKENISTGKLVDLYLNLGLVLNDAFVSCWFSKYHYNLMRPETYIQHTFDKKWHSHYHSPSFPAYPSGHSFAGAASAVILADAFGDPYRLTDRSHSGRKDFKGTPRTFSSFDEMARENAISRILLGVHFRMDIEEGLKLGRELGEFFLSVKKGERNALLLDKEK